MLRGLPVGVRSGLFEEDRQSTLCRRAGTPAACQAERQPCS